MTHDVRYAVLDGTYFFTVRLQDQSSNLLTAQIGLLRDAVRLCRKRLPFEIDSAVILPAQMHMIWVLPAGDAGLSARWRMIKATFMRHVPVTDDLSALRRRHGDTGIWQRRLRPHVIRDGADLALHRHLIVTAPVRAGLVRRSADWPYGAWQPRGAGVKTTDPAPSCPDPAIPALTS